MKKIIAFILALFYLCVSTGATVHVTYCMGKLVGKELLHTSSKKCSRCGMEKSKNNGCCKDEAKQLKIESDQNIPASGLQTFQVFQPALSTHTVEMPVIKLATIKGVFQYYAPPPKSQIAVYLRNCVFLI